VIERRNLYASHPGGASAIRKPVVLGVTTDPEPHHPVINVDAKCSIVKANANGMKAAHFLEVERRMSGIALKHVELPIRDFSYR